jgi:hypothetical protein
MTWWLALANTGYLFGDCKISGIGTLRDLAGRFTTAQGAVADAHEALAKKVQAAAADNLRANILRPAVSTGRLEEAIRDPQDIIFDRFQWGVGRIAWLAASPAKYWRTQEEGSLAVWKHPFAGTVLRGTWGGSISGFYANRWGTVARGGRPIPVGSGGKFIPLGTKGQQAVLRPNAKGHARVLAKVGSGLGSVVHTEIAPKEFFTKAFADLGGVAAVQQAYKDAFDAAGLKGLTFDH